MKLGYEKNELIHKEFVSLLPNPQRDLPALVNLFKRILSSPKAILRSQKLAFIKKNGLLVTFTANLKYTTDTSESQYISIMGHFDRFTKPKAKILVTRKGEILANSGPTCTTLDLPRVYLRENGFTRIDQVIEVNQRHLQKMAKLASSLVSIASKASAMISYHKMRTNSLRDENDKIKELEYTNIELEKATTIDKQADASPLKDPELMLDIVKPANLSPDSFILELRKNIKKSKKRSKETSGANSLLNGSNSSFSRLMTSSVYHKAIRNCGFYFKLGPNFRFVGGFNKDTRSSTTT